MTVVLKNTEHYSYTPRKLVSIPEVWEIDPLKLKVYGILAQAQKLTEDMIRDAHAFVSEELPALVKQEGRSNDLGFVVIHPGDLGVSVLALWWVQGSVLCQHIKRNEWGSKQPLDMVSRPVIGCVWELGLINAEQDIWRDTMMTSAPDPAEYLATRPSISMI